jgi:hypothetical protein
MDKSYREIMQDIQDKVSESFQASGERDQYIMNTLENFVYRYLEDDKVGPGKTEKIADDLYRGSSLTTSLKLAMEFAPEDQKPELQAAIKESFAQKKKPTMNQQIIIDARGINAEGEGNITLHAVINWDFPEHPENQKQKVWSYTYPSEDWGYLRKHLAIHLEELCEHF